MHDHIEYILTSIEMFTGVSENLINYTFNVRSYHDESSHWRLLPDCAC